MRWVGARGMGVKRSRRDVMGSRDGKTIFTAPKVALLVRKLASFKRKEALF